MGEISTYLEAKTAVRVCCYANPLYPHERRELGDDDLRIDVHASITTIRPSTINLQRTVFFTKSLNRSRQALLSSASSILAAKDLELPFDWTKQNLLLWGVEETSVEGITARLSQAARDIAIKDSNGREMIMVINVSRSVKLTMDKKDMLLDLNVIIEGEQNPMSDWIAKNRKYLLLNLQDDSSTSSCARQALSKLYRVDKMFLGLKSVEVVVEEEEEEAACCAICLKGFRHGETVIGMPCSHVFHGFCILVWINRTKTCPLCRFDLLN